MTTSLLSLCDVELLESTRALIRRSGVVEAEVLAHLAEVDERKLYLERAFPSMFAFCVGELGMSEDVVYNRLAVARVTRRLPAVLECLRSGRVHLSGLRLLAPHLDETNCADLLSEATGKSKRDIEVLVTRFVPKPPVPTTIRKLHAGAAPIASAQPAAAAPPASVRETPASPAPLELAPSERPRISPLTPQTFALRLTIDEALRQKVEQAQDLMKHRVGNGDLAAILDEALDLLIEKVKKERFGVGRKARPVPADPIPGEGTEGTPHVTRHVPDPIRRTVYERDGGRCTFVSEDGRRCAETGGLELDHLDGFAITREHSAEGLALRCRPHNAHAADKMYGPAKMARMKNSSTATRPGTGAQEHLL